MQNGTFRFHLCELSGINFNPSKPDLPGFHSGNLHFAAPQQIGAKYENDHFKKISKHTTGRIFLMASKKAHTYIDQHVS